MATVKAEVLIRGTIELPAYEETDEEMEYTIEQAKKSPEEIFDDIDIKDVDFRYEHWK
ncbi:hypothetical protein [Staphylococcus hominis]|uniref:Uncharacterized protein n=1 Tax=Staphylococcus hominis TaxID=1290 RepID=A0A8X8GTR6_STAHO|nr:hypothetical protein [Staphylococcus hominis]MCM5673539.1 hypothetical protein [Staphylococcus hominis]MDK7928873.1 hypothetical protein [Staphylococcus hominis]MDS3898417.1 hypothetical protein [Staphylococcus hominis]DAI85695.1 MAG TPA: hypothetical protein [Caudoviricetes sp.]